MDAKMKVERAAAGAAIDGVLKYVNHGDDRTKALLNLTDFVQKFTGNMFAEKTFDNIRTMLQNPDNKWVQYVNRGLDELDPQVIKMTALNLGFQAAFVGTKQIRMNREKYNCNIPWTMLMDPTSACNLHCTGCWAAEYGHKLNLSYEKLSDIISQGKELGTYFYMFTGGEPLVRKNGLLYATPLMLVLILVELSDVIFAVDSIPAIFAATTDPFIVLTSNLFAILGLRAMYFLLAGVAERFSMLKYGLAVILVFIGIKMLIVDFYHIPIAVSLGVVFGILVMTFIINAWVNYRHDKQRVE